MPETKNLYVIEVIPLAVLPPNVPQVLSYYHDRMLDKGAMVEIQLNNRKTQGIVVSSELLESQKLLLRKSGFQLKKISSVLFETPQVDERQFKLTLWLAQEYVAPLGLALKTVLPPFFLKKRYPPPRPPKLTVPAHALGRPEWVLCRAKESADHIARRMESVKTGQVLVLVPETRYVRHFKEKLDGTAMHSQLSMTEVHSVWTTAAEGTLRTVVGTRQALFLPFLNLRLVVVVDPLHEFYKSDLSPKYRAPDLAKRVAELHGADMLFVSNILGVTAYHHLEQRELSECRDLVKPWRAAVDIIDMVAELKQGYVGMFAAAVRERLDTILRARGRVLIFAARRGYSGILLCQHCGHSFKCPNCDVPIRIHQAVKPVLFCHRCGISRSYPYFCPNCRSSQVKPSGPAGSQKIFETIRTMMAHGQLPPVPAVILDTDVTRNETEEEEIMATVAKPTDNRGVILITTQKVFSYVFDHSFDYVVILQFDAATAGTDFQASEQLWWQLEKLADFEPRFFDVQTFHHKELVPLLAAHQYDRLYPEELQLRQAFHYPPFSRIVRLSFSHKMLQKATTESRVLIERLKMAGVQLRLRDQFIISETSPAFIKKEKGLYTASVLLKFISSAEPVPSLDSKVLRSILRFVPSQWLIDVDPRTTL